MSLSASLPVNSAAAPTGTSPDALGMAQSAAMPEGGISVFDVLLQQIAMETPAQPDAVPPPALVQPANTQPPLTQPPLTQSFGIAGDVMAAVSAQEIEEEIEAPEAERSETDAATAPQMMVTVNAPVIQPQANDMARAPELSQQDFAADAKGAKAKPDAKPAPSARDSKDIDETQATDSTDLAGKTSSVPVTTSEKVDPKAVLSKVRDAVTGSDPQPVQPAADPRTVSAAATEAPSPTLPSAFSLQAISDTQGSYNATGASTTAGSNMSKAAVETLSALSMQISKKLEQGNTKFAIELYPADLGKVEVSLHIARDGKTMAHLTFDSPVTAASFSASEPELRQQLANAGLSVDKDALSFSSREGGNGFGSAMGQDQQQQQSQARHASRAMEAALKVADDSDLNAALNTAIQAMRTGASKLALNLIV